jgi:hypothetical protein
MIRALFGLAVLLGAAPALALNTAYVNFEHPDGWKCELSQGVWICQSTIEPDRKESVVLSIATMRTEWDSLDNYLEYLKKPRPVQDEDGNQLTSKVTYARKRNINGVEWIDSLQYNSELPGFWARYLATVQDKLAILITYIVSDEFYQKLAPQFEKMVASLKPNAELNVNHLTEQGTNPLPWSEKNGSRPREEVLKGLLNTGKKAPKNPTAKPIDPDAKPEGDMTTMLVGGGALLVIMILFLRIRRKRKEKNQAKSRQARKAPTPPAPTPPSKKAG